MQLRKALSVVALIALVALAACGGGAEAPAPAADESAPASNLPDLSQAGAVAGTVAFSGEVQAQAIQMAADPFCQQAHSEVVMRSPVMVDAEGGLSNVVVHVGGSEIRTFRFE